MRTTEDTIFQASVSLLYFVYFVYFVVAIAPLVPCPRSSLSLQHSALHPSEPFLHHFAPFSAPSFSSSFFHQPLTIRIAPPVCGRRTLHASTLRRSTS